MEGNWNWNEYEKTDEEKEFEAKSKRVTDEIDQLAAGFAEELKNQGLGKETINMHVSTVYSFLYDFMWFTEFDEYDKALRWIDDYMGGYCIARFLGSRKRSLKSVATSIRKFYKYLVDIGKYSEEDYDRLCEAIKAGMPNWESNREGWRQGDIYAIYEWP